MAALYSETFFWLPRVVLALICCSTAGFYAWAGYLAWDFFRSPRSAPDWGGPSPGISVLKPV